MAQRVKHLPVMLETHNPWVGKIPWRRKWQPTPVFLLGESHRQRSQVGYSPQGRKESDTTEHLHFLFFTLLYTVKGFSIVNEEESDSESHSVMSDSLRPHGLYSPWNSLGQNTGMGSLSLLQRIFPTQGLNPVSRIAGRFFTR